MTVSQVPAEAITALESGNLIEAVKITRERNGIGLKESKDAVDAFIKANPRAADTTIKANPGLKRQLISERSSGYGNKAIAFIGLFLVATILYLAASQLFW